MKAQSHKLHDGTQIYIEERTITDLARAYEQPLGTPNQQYETESWPEHMDSVWTGLRTKAEVQELLELGWAKGSARLAELRLGLTANVPAAKSRRRKARWADDGDSLDPDKALAGQWESAYRTTRREVSAGTSTVELMVGWGAPGRMQAEDLFWGGAQALVVTDILEEAGYSVRLVGQMCSYRAGAYAWTKVLLKEAGEPLRIDALAGVACHSGVFRTVGLRGFWNAPTDMGHGCGRITRLDDLEVQLRAIGEWPEEALTIPYAFDRHTAVKNIEAVLSRVQAGREAV